MRDSLLTVLMLHKQLQDMLILFVLCTDIIGMLLFPDQTRYSFLLLWRRLILLVPLLLFQRVTLLLMTSHEHSILDHRVNQILGIDISKQ